MDILYRRGRATAAEVQQALPKPPSYSAVRALLRILEEKGHVKHQEKGLRYVFLPAITREKAKRSALAHLVQTFFEGSAAQAVTALLDLSARSVTRQELDRIAQRIEQARRQGR